MIWPSNSKKGFENDESEDKVDRLNLLYSKLKTWNDPMKVIEKFLFSFWQNEETEQEKSDFEDFASKKSDFEDLASKKSDFEDLASKKSDFEALASHSVSDTLLLNSEMELLGLPLGFASTKGFDFRWFNLIHLTYLGVTEVIPKDTESSIETFTEPENSVQSLHSLISESFPFNRIGNIEWTTEILGIS